MSNDFNPRRATYGIELSDVGGVGNEDYPGSQFLINKLKWISEDGGRPDKATQYDICMSRGTLIALICLLERQEQIRHAVVDLVAIGKIES